MQKIIAFLLILAFAASCKKDNDSPKTSGEIILSSQIKGGATNYYVDGFSFDQVKLISYNLTSPTIPDLVLENNLNLSGKVIGANLRSPQNDAAFYLYGDFATLAEAEAAFNTITEAGNHSYFPTADAVAANQIYIFKSRSNKYGKFLIKDFKIVPMAATDHVEITLKWVYQPSGEKTFQN